MEGIKHEYACIEPQPIRCDERKDHAAKDGIGKDGRNAKLFALVLDGILLVDDAFDGDEEGSKLQSAIHVSLQGVESRPNESYRHPRSDDRKADHRKCKHLL